MLPRRARAVVCSAAATIAARGTGAAPTRASGCARNVRGARKHAGRNAAPEARTAATTRAGSAVRTGTAAAAGTTRSAARALTAVKQGSVRSCCPRGEKCALRGTAAGLVLAPARSVCCPPDRVVPLSGGSVCCQPGYLSLGGKLVVPPGGGGGLCCEASRVCGSGPGDHVLRTQPRLRDQPGMPQRAVRRCRSRLDRCPRRRIDTDQNPGVSPVRSGAATPRVAVGHERRSPTTMHPGRTAMIGSVVYLQPNGR